MRSVHTFLGAYLTDLPEQQSLAGVASNYSPSSTAGPDSLGDPVPHPLREGRETLDLIRKVLDLLGKSNDRGNLAKE